MSSQFQNRLVGTLVFVALGIIFLPDLLDGKKEIVKEEYTEIPLRPDTRVNSVSEERMKVESLESIELESGNAANGSANAQMPQAMDDGAFLVDEADALAETDASQNDLAQTGSEQSGTEKSGTVQSSSAGNANATTAVGAASASALAAQKAVEPKRAESKAAESKAAESKVAESKTAESKAADKAKAEAKIKAEAKTEPKAESKPKTEVKPDTAKPKTEAKPNTAKPNTAKPAEIKAVENTPTESKPAERKPQPYKPEIQPYQPDGPVAQKPMVKSVEPKSSASSTAKGGWTLQLGAFSNAANVNGLVKKLRSAGFKAYTVPSRPVDGSLTKVYVGPDVSEARLKRVAADVESLTQLRGKLMPYNPLE